MKHNFHIEYDDKINVFFVCIYIYNITYSLRVAIDVASQQLYILSMKSGAMMLTATHLLPSCVFGFGTSKNSQTDFLYCNKIRTFVTKNE